MTMRLLIHIAFDAQEISRGRKISLKGSV